MPNWVSQDLHVVGPKTEIDRFIATGFVRKRRGELDDVLDFLQLCPLGRREKRDTYTHPSGVVLSHFRTRTQALFSMITSWDYPAEFYARLSTHWPQLAFACSINEDMHSFGGVLTVRNGVATNHVSDYDGDYDRRAHGRAVRALLKEWGEFLTGERAWRVMPHRVWDHKSIPFDAHFDDDFWFYFRSREDMDTFRTRYRSTLPMRLVDGSWKRTR